MASPTNTHAAIQIDTGNDTFPPIPVSSAGKATSALVKDILFGSLAGTLGKIIEYPFDTVKVRLQIQSEPTVSPGSATSHALSSPHYSGPLDCFRQSIRRDGFASLYRGVSAPIFAASVETSSLFWSYRIAQDIYLWNTGTGVKRKREDLSLGVLCGCGAVSGAFTSFLLTPIELVKCQMQVPLPAAGAASASFPGVGRQTSGPLQIIASVWKHHGVAGFWHGQMGTLIRETGGSAAWFGAKEGVSAGFQHWNALRRTAYDLSSSLDISNNHDDVAAGAATVHQKLPIWQQVIAGAAAGMSYNFVLFPADTIKSRMQTQEVVPAKGTRARATFWTSGRELWEQQGLKGMYRGCGITVARAAPSSAIIFVVYEGLMGWWT